MKKGLILILLFVYGVACGVFFSLSKARASSAIGETSGGEAVASVVYDEHWTAASALQTTNAAGNTVQWAAFSNFPNDTTQSQQPKMVVTKWTVHGHIHFR